MRNKQERGYKDGEERTQKVSRCPSTYRRLLMGANDTEGIPPAGDPAGEMIVRAMCFPGPKGGREKLVTVTKSTSQGFLRLIHLRHHPRHLP